MASGVHERGKYAISFLYPDTCLKTMSCCHQVDNSVKLIWFACGNSLSRVYFDLTEDEDVKGGFGRLLTSSAMKVKKEVLCGPCGPISFLGYPDTFLKAKFATCHGISVLITLANYLWADYKLVFHGGSIWLVLRYSLFLNVHPVFFSLLIQLHQLQYEFATWKVPVVDIDWHIPKLL